MSAALDLRRLCRCSAVVAVVLWACAMAISPAAGAEEAKPFEITKFSMQTIEKTRIVSFAGKQAEIENVPYAFTQAGGHPWALSASGEFTSEEVKYNEKGKTFAALIPTSDPKDIVVSLPLGLQGDPLAVQRCPLSRVLANSKEPCPGSSQIGYYRLMWEGGRETLDPIIDVTPEAGQSAEFVFENEGKIPFLLTAHLVHSSQGYGFTVVSNGVPGVQMVSFETTFWGVPSDPSHDPMRGLFCNSLSRGEMMRCAGGGQPAGGEAPVPFLSMPTDCAAGAETATVRADSWERPGRVREGQSYEGFAQASAQFPGVTGCDLLAFDPSVEVNPNTLVADEPVELGVNVKVPQPETPGTYATPHLRDAVVSLPQGMSISPGAVDGIQACEKEGLEGINFEGPLSEKVGLDGELQLAPGHCPDASIVGEAEAITPLLPEPVKGQVYLARPGCGGAGQAPCTEQDALDGNLYKLYLELGGEGQLANSGIDIKAEGRVEANPATGQLTSVFEENPQTPFSELKIHLNGGPRAPIDNPAGCGVARTTAEFTPWSAPGTTPEGLSVAGAPNATAESFFDVDLAGDGLATPCPTLPWSPGFTAGTVTPNAGQFSSFTMNLTRKDREQFVKGIQLHTPPGLLAMLSSVPLCGEAQADAGTCSESSKIGTTRVASGAGSHPFEIEGNVYLTGPHDGAPFGLSIVTHATAGPFNLGLVVVRARIDIDPTDSTATITTDETGPYAVPQILDGVPLRLQRITVDIDRPDFMFNPTNCRAQQITATVSGSQDATAAVSSPFAVGACKSLRFEPSFAVSTSAHTTRRFGASLEVKLAYPKGAMGNDANVAKVKVELPKQLPARSETLKEACLAEVFDSNPARCPAASVVGIARAKTPVLPAQLGGPAYFVSHGGAEFPSLVVVLQGEGVRVDLVGETYISKKTNVTSSTFNTVPDVPVESFELYLPQGSYSALAANGNLCKAKGGLHMPTEFVAQNGAVIKQSTKVAVTGCRQGKARAARGAPRGRKGAAAIRRGER